MRRPHLETSGTGTAGSGFGMPQLQGLLDLLHEGVDVLRARGHRGRHREVGGGRVRDRHGGGIRRLRVDRRDWNRDRDLVWLRLLLLLLYLLLLLLLLFSLSLSGCRHRVEEWNSKFDGRIEFDFQNGAAFCANFLTSVVEVVLY